MSDADVRSPLLAYFTARALRRTALRAVLGGLALVAAIVLDDEARTMPAGDLVPISLFIVAAVALALAPVSLVELHAARTGRSPARGFVVAFALSVAATPLLITQLVYGLAVVADGATITEAMETVSELWRELQRTPDMLGPLALLSVGLPVFLIMVSCIHQGTFTSSGGRILLIVLTFPAGLVALAIYAVVDRFDDLAFGKAQSAGDDGDGAGVHHSPSPTPSSSSPPPSA